MIITPDSPEFKATQRAKQNQLNRIAKATDKATESQWQMIDFAVKAWIQAYPKQWMEFQQDLNRGRNTYNDAKEGGLKSSQWRNTASFPVALVYNPVTGNVESNNLLTVLQKIIPHLTHKNSVNFSEFLKRYPSFRPSEKSNESSFQPITGYLPPMPIIPVPEAPIKVKKTRKPRTKKVKDV